MSDKITSKQIVHRVTAEGVEQSKRVQLAREIILTIRTKNGTLAEVSCTPSALKELTAGWLFAEGKIKSRDDIREMAYDADEKTMHVTLEAPSQEMPRSREGRLDHRIEWTQEELGQIYRSFRQDPPLFAQTHATHSCMIVRHRDTEANGNISDSEPVRTPEVLSCGEVTNQTSTLEVLYRSEDSGRHSAMDKAIGWALLHDVDLSRCMFFLSGRSSTRMAMRAAKAGLSALAGVGVVTAEAVEIAREHGMALIGYVREDSAVWFTEFEEAK